LSCWAKRSIPFIPRSG